MSKEWDRNNFPMGITIEYSTTGQAGGHITDSAPESTHQPVQQLFGSYCASVPYQIFKLVTIVRLLLKFMVAPNDYSKSDIISLES